ncbi:DUF4083 family protein [Bacillus cereus group sp. N8]|uniref:DUF4083 family protein n=1 Tax=Bacillus proteolyticus TaxID=2026192 RepID=A0ABV3IIN5_9BACI|nr:DUF4083 family protein [Bacillus cereus group sp. N8]PGV63627.1 DUF4083 domain-containing protein [Bacillus cereus]
MNLFENNIFTLIYNCLVIGLIVLFFISFTLFIRISLQNSDRRCMKRGRAWLII